MRTVWHAETASARAHPSGAYGGLRAGAAAEEGQSGGDDVNGGERLCCNTLGLRPQEALSGGHTTRAPQGSGAVPGICSIVKIYFILA